MLPIWPESDDSGLQKTRFWTSWGTGILRVFQVGRTQGEDGTKRGGGGYGWQEVKGTRDKHWRDGNAFCGMGIVHRCPSLCLSNDRLIADQAEDDLGRRLGSQQPSQSSFRGHCVPRTAAQYQYQNLHIALRLYREHLFLIKESTISPQTYPNLFGKTGKRKQENITSSLPTAR
jgi:hypothetical protein